MSGASRSSLVAVAVLVVVVIVIGLREWERHLYLVRLTRCQNKSVPVLRVLLMPP